METSPSTGEPTTARWMSVFLLRLRKQAQSPSGEVSSAPGPIVWKAWILKNLRCPILLQAPWCPVWVSGVRVQGTFLGKTRSENPIALKGFSGFLPGPGQPGWKEIFLGLHSQSRGDLGCAENADPRSGEPLGPGAEPRGAVSPSSRPKAGLRPVQKPQGAAEAGRKALV